MDEPGRHVYELERRIRVRNLLSGGLLLGAGILVWIAVIHHHFPDNWFVSYGGTLLGVVGLGIFGRGLPARVVIEDGDITVRNALRSRTVHLQDVEGFWRQADASNQTFLSLRDGSRPIRIPAVIGRNTEFLEWRRQLTDLDDKNREARLQAIETCDRLGKTPGDRFDSLYNASRRKSLFILAVLVAGAVLHFAARQFQQPAAILLALTPFWAMLQLRRWPVMYRITSNDSDPRADVLALLWLPSMALGLFGPDVALLSIWHLWPFALLPAAVVATIFFICCRSAIPVRRPLQRTILIVGVIPLLYGFGIAKEVDLLAGSPTPVHYTVRLAAKHHSRDGRDYYFDLPPWGPLHQPNHIAVTAEQFAATPIGETACVVLHPGLLRVPWTVVVPCGTGQ
jgi:hypothetical protein